MYRMPAPVVSCGDHRLWLDNKINYLSVAGVIRFEHGSEGGGLKCRLVACR